MSQHMLTSSAVLVTKPWQQCCLMSQRLEIWQRWFDAMGRGELPAQPRRGKRRIVIVNPRFRVKALVY